MRWAVLFPLLLLAVSAMGQQDLFQWRIAAHAGITRSLSDIESSYNDVNWDRSRVQGLELSKSLGYGVSLGLGVEHALVSGNDVLTGRKDRALNFMSELYTAQMELTFRMDNGKLLKYDARFAPFVALGVGVGKYDVFGDLHSASGSRYYHWSDGTIRDQAESGSNAANATVITQDGDFETRSTDLATEDNKPKDQNFVFIPARIGLKWRICDRMAAELYYGFNWTFTDWIDDVHDAYPARQPQGELAYISNPTGRIGQRGDPGTNDKYQSIGLNLAYYFGKRSTSYRMEPIYVDDRSLPPPSPAAKPVAKPPAQPAPTNVVINVERITVGRLSVDTLVVGTIVERKKAAQDSAAGHTIRKTGLDSLLQNTAGQDTSGIDSLRNADLDSLGTIMWDSLRTALPPAKIEMHEDTIVPALPDTPRAPEPDSLRTVPPVPEVEALGDSIMPVLADTLRAPEPDSLLAPTRKGLEEPRPDSVVPLLPDTVQQLETDSLPAGSLKQRYMGADSLVKVEAPVIIRDTLQEQRAESIVEVNTQQVVHDTVHVYRERSTVAGRVDTVYVDRPVPAAGQEQQAPTSTQPPQQVIIREEPRERSRTSVVPVIVSTNNTKTVADPALQDSLLKMKAENIRLRHLADSLRTGTSGTYPIDTTATFPDTTIQPGINAGYYPMIMNGLLVDRIATLERYIEVMDDQRSAVETDSLKRRIEAMDRELEDLRAKHATAKDSGEVRTVTGIEETFVDTVVFSSGSSRVGSVARLQLLKSGKRLAAAHVQRVLVTGTTDKSGDAGFNLRLSQERADAVKRVLVEAGVPIGAITAKGLGERLARHVYDESERVVVVQAIIPGGKEQE
ncbi:MAG: OmpA family protein [Flavobacteriales bacterium]|nr:OmpA family protein [Flavobacteriales bacterium]